MELRWEKCRGNRYAGYDGHEVVDLLYPQMPETAPRQEGSLTDRLVYLKYSS